MPKKILAIDDERAVRRSFELTFEDSDYLITTAGDGLDGIEKFKQDKFDLVFLDLKMPRMDGIETLRELRKLDKEIPIYIVTAFHKEFYEQLQEATKDGMDFEVLRKPVDREQILLITKGILEEPTAY